MTLFLILAAVLVIYSRSIRGEFLFDDHAITDFDFYRRCYVLLGCIRFDDPRNRTSPPTPLWQIAFEDMQANPSTDGGHAWLHQFAKHNRNFPEALRSFFLEPRALTHMGYVWTWRFSGWLLNDSFNPFAWHTVNVGLHLANTFLVFLLASYLRPDIAGPAAFLFAVHPHQVAAVSYVSGRASLQVTFFALASIVIASTSSSLWSLPAAFLACLFAQQSKEDGLLWILLLSVTFAALRFFFGSI